jgi:diaminohydroxyphosphoribosylaminopyrimidine deaminase/5-amino-6-(5-phosphoribosylamino)uracil reductase
VLLKLAVSADGMIAAARGARTAISGAEAGARVHMMRAMADAVLVGAGTWAADDPELTCRLPGMADRSPVRVVLDREARLPLGAALVRTIDQAPLWIVTGQGADNGRAGALAKAGAEILPLPPGGEGRFDMADVLALLGARGITRLLVEGGAAVAQSLLDASLVDELALVEAPAELGRAGVPAPPALAEAIRPGGRFALVSQDRLGPDTLRIFEAA